MNNIETLELSEMAQLTGGTAIGSSGISPGEAVTAGVLDAFNGAFINSGGITQSIVNPPQGGPTIITGPESWMTPEQLHEQNGLPNVTDSRLNLIPGQQLTYAT